MMRIHWVVGLVLGTTGLSSAAEPLADRYLSEGRLKEGEQALSEALKADPKDDQARFGLGAVQYFRAVERLSQSLYRHGFAPEKGLSLGLSFPLPFPPNPDPEAIRYADLKPMLQAWIDDLARAEKTLSKITDEDVKMPLHIGLCRLDIDGDGQPDDSTVAWRLYAQIDRRHASSISADAAADFIIRFDRGDVAWLRGYCHLLMALSEAMLAYDGRELFEHCGQLLFAKAETAYQSVFANEPRYKSRWPGGILDMVAAIHLMDLPVSEPERMARALEHLEAVIAMSRESWKFILAETDNDHEWVPNPDQDTMMPNGRMTEEMVEGWKAFLDEADAILAGKKLVPFWRGHGKRGVNLRRVFLEPRRFDLVLWVQGTAAVPYLEDGPTTSPETWARSQRLFQGQFVGWAAWIN